MPNPLRLISEMQTPKPNSIIVCGILVLEEKRAAAKIIIKNIGIKYSKVTRPPPESRDIVVSSSSNS